MSDLFGNHIVGFPMRRLNYAAVMVLTFHGAVSFDVNPMIIIQITHKFRTLN